MAVTEVEVTPAMRRELIGHRIRMARTKPSVRLTQQGLADQLAVLLEDDRHVSGDVVSHWERGITDCPATVLSVIAEVCGEPVENFYDWLPGILRSPSSARPRQRNRAGQRRYPQSRDVPLVAAVPS
jgi:hypothetical protein